MPHQKKLEFKPAGKCLILKWMLGSILLTIALMAATQEQVFSWNDLRTTPRPGQIELASRDAGKAGLRTWKSYEKDLNLVKVSAVDGQLVIDTREFHRRNPKATVLFNRNITRIRPGQKITAEIELAASPDGQPSHFYLEGQTKTKKHFYRGKENMLTGTLHACRLNILLPENLASLYYRIDFTKAGIYRVGKLNYSYPIPDAVDGTVNQLINGGAERGTYNVFPCNIYNHARRNTPDVRVDTRDVHGGKKSFRMTAPDERAMYFYFAPVQLHTGRPVAFSCWMKADRPIKADLLLFASMGNAYFSGGFELGRDWKKITLFVPRVGDRKLPHGSVIGRPEIYAELPDGGNLVTPRININSVVAGTKVWIDDAVVQYAETTTDGTPESLNAFGSLDRPEGYYRAGEKITGMMCFEGSAPAAEVSYELRDVWGRLVKTWPEQKIDLPGQLKFEITPPDALRGPMNLVFTVKAGNRKQMAGLYFGVIDDPARGQMNKRFGLNLSDYFNNKPNDVDSLLPILKDFHIGALRLWANGGAFKYVHKFKPLNIFTLFCLDSPVRRQLWLLNDYSVYLKQIEPDVKRLRGKIDAYEIFNEPNIWSGRTKNPDPSRFRDADIHAVVDGTRIIAGFLRQTDPATLIVALGCCGTNASYIGEYLRLGAGKYIDAISQHSYRDEPESPDYAEDLKNLNDAIARNGKKLPVYDSESGSITILQYPDNLIPLSARKSAAHDLRLAVIGLSNGLVSYMQFCLRANLIGNSYGANLIAGDHAGGGRGLPGPYLFAARAVGDLLADARPTKPVKLGLDYRCYLFDRGDKRIAALWKWHGPAGSLKLPSRVDLMDMYGNWRQTNVIPTDGYPVFIATNYSVRELSDILLEARQSGPATSEPVRLNLAIKDEAHAVIRLQNTTSAPLSGSIVLRNRQTAYSALKEFHCLPAEEQTSLVLPLNQKIALTPTKYEWTVKVPALKWQRSREVSLQGVVIPHYAGTLRIDGDLSDWPSSAQTILLNHQNAVRKKTWTTEDEKISARLQFLWSEERLYIGVTVHKNTFSPPTLSAQSLWGGDGLQIAFDTLQDAVRDTPSYQNDDFEYALAMFHGQPTVNRHAASSEKYDSLQKPIGVVKDVVLAISNQPDRTVYEIAFPQFAVSPFQLREGAVCRFNLIVNLGKAGQRIGWLELTPGIGQFKRPGQFMPMVLGK